MDLASYDRVALVTFSADPARAALGPLATQKFSEEVLASQSGFELLELGPADSAVARLLAAGDAPGAAREVGRHRQVPAVFFGHVGVTNAKPSGSIGGGGSVNVNASVSAELSVRLLSTESGGTLWRSSGSSSRSVGHLSTTQGRLPSISATDPNAAYGAMVDDLVAQVTSDFRPTWRKQ
ncbi:MAG TPA: hypothetical protein VFV65_07800 [Gemmatimonadales bacterium]|nr:hypothetical protein [Gemmatimonadales bacterium]